MCEQYRLDDIIRQAVRKFSPQFIRRKLKLIYEPSKKTVITDEKWLLFVVEQVVSNAVKYTPSGEIEIYCEEPFTLCIRDTGIEIAAEDLPRISKLAELLLAKMLASGISTVFDISLPSILSAYILQ